MPQIIVDGITYVPAGQEQHASFGIGITTHNRHDQLKKTLAHYRKYTPANIPIVVVDDGSTTPVENADYRFPANVGIATAKNKCIEMLLARGCQHIFLSDDDAFPIADNYWQPYIDSPEPHLFAVFPDPTAKSSKIEVVYRDSKHIGYAATRGYFLYFHRSVIDKVGGFDTRFHNAFEHVELSNRIHAAGLTTWAYQDVAGSDALIFCEDSQPGCSSVIPDTDRRVHEKQGKILLEQLSGRTDFVPFGTRDLVLSCLFTTRVDPQRGTHLEADTGLASALLRSLPGEVIVFCDFENTHKKFVQVEVSENPYIQRWITYRQFLIAHPEIRWVWCVDATDVESLRDPFTDMQPNVLYCGWENQIVGTPWMLSNHSASADWITENATLPLLNAGVVGGDRATMLKFTNRLIQHWLTAKAHKREDKAGDMAYFNRAAYSMNVQTGPRITTLFKADQRNEFSLWKHK
jgi:hypothetical protein